MSDMKKEFAEECNYWKSGNSSPDSWLEKSVKLIRENDGKAISFASAFSQDKSVFMITFELEGQQYKIIWPVVKSKSGNDKAASALKSGATNTWS